MQIVEVHCVLTGRPFFDAYAKIGPNKLNLKSKNMRPSPGDDKLMSEVVLFFIVLYIISYILNYTISLPWGWGMLISFIVVGFIWIAIKIYRIDKKHENRNKK